jgi:hypothetical protein
MRECCDGQECNEVGSVSREAVINAVLYGNKFERRKLFLRAELRHGNLHLTERDEELDFDPRSQPEPTKPKNPLREPVPGSLPETADRDRADNWTGNSLNRKNSSLPLVP